MPPLIEASWSLLAPGPVRVAVALLVIAGMLLVLSSVWSRAVPGSLLRRGWWLLSIVVCLWAVALPAAALHDLLGALAELGSATVLLAALVRAAPRVARGQHREHVSEALLAGGVVAYAVLVVSPGAVDRSPVGLAVLVGLAGALWLVALGPPPVRPRAPRPRVLVSVALALLVIARVDVVAGTGVLAPGWPPVLTVLAALLLAVVLVLAETGAPVPRPAPAAPGLSVAQTLLVLVGVLAGPAALVGGVLADVPAPLLAPAIGGAALALLAVTNLMRQVTERGERAWRAQHDTLTGLPTEPLFEDRLQQAIVAARRSGRGVAVAFVDLDGFKAINDTLGHEAGDRVLCAVAQRLGESLRAQDTVARRSGDEFLILLPEVTGPDATEGVVQRFLQTLVEPVAVDAERPRVGASVGLALWPRDGADAGELMNHADAAMYEAKAAGRGDYRWYRRTTATRARLRTTLREQLATALVEGEIDLDHEPVVDVRDGTVSRLVAHVRWNHPRLGRLTPEAFVPVAEASGLASELDLEVLRLACRAAAHRRRTGVVELDVVVPVSDVSTTRGELAERVLEVLADHGVPPTSLSLAVGEEGLRRGGATFARTMDVLAEEGVGAVVTGFGTADVGIARLSRVRLRGIELDPSLVARATGMELPVIETAIRLAEGLGLEVTAAGVDTAPQRDLLRARGCVLARGPALAPPVPAGVLDARLGERARRGEVLLARELTFVPAPEAPSDAADLLATVLADRRDLPEALLADALRRASPRAV